MPNVCLPPKIADKFKQAFVKGEIDPEKLAKMTSEERHDFFKSFSDKESATTINSLFESKLLLKNQQKGMVTWAKSLTGMSTEAKRDLISRIQRMDRVLSEPEKDAFLKDLAATKLGVSISHEEANTIAKLSQNVEAARTAMENGGDRMKYGEAKVKLANYVNELKINADKLNFGDLRHNPVGTTEKILDRAAGNAKAITASMDNSAIFRQGWKVLWTNPRIWAKNARQSFGNLVKQFGSKNVMNEVHADIVSRPNYDRMVKAKLDVGNLEEAFPTTAPEKIPFLGRAYKASEAAYTAFVQKTRADVFDKYMDVAKKADVNIDDPKELLAIGKLVNSLTGRGYLGSLEKVAKPVNNVFFSPRFLKSNFDMLTAHQLQRGVTPFARKQAAKNLLKVVAGTATVFATANALRPGSVQLDPRSSDFGKIKVGNTRFDITGGMGSIATLASRVLTLSSKSTTTGQVSKLNSGKYGSQSALDVVNTFAENKLSPVAGVIRDLLEGKDASGNKTTLGGEIGKTFTPIGIQNFAQLKGDKNSANKLLTVIADGLGISANDYMPRSGAAADWNNNTGKELTQFKNAVGATKFKAANQQYNDKLGNWQSNMAKSPAFQKLSAAAQKTVQTKEEDKLKTDIFKQNGFKYKAAKTPKNQYSEFLQ